MAVLEIPLTTIDPAFSFQVDLEGKIYMLDFSFNKRMNKWVMGVKDQIGNPIITGIKLISMWPLNRQYPEAAMPPGMLAVLDTAQGNADPTEENLGQRCKLYYDESTE